MRKFIIVLIVVALSFTLITTFLGCQDENSSSTVGTMSELGYVDTEYVKTLSSIPKVSELGLPDDVLYNHDDSYSRFGLYLYTGTGFASVLEENFPFDDTKPCIIYIHGMGSNAIMSNYKTLHEQGYNVLAFNWGIFARESNLNMPKVAQKVWFYDGDRRYNDAEDSSLWHTCEDFKYSMVECFIAYYTEMLNRFPNYSGSRITISGHSYGGMLLFGVTSYLTTAFKCNLLSAQYLPDQIVYLDPYLMKVSTTSLHIRWLGDIANPEKDGGITYLATQAVKEARSLGIAQSLFFCGPGVALPAKLQTPDLYAELSANLIYVDGDATDVCDRNMSESHNYAMKWPFFTTFTHKDLSAPDQIAYSIFNPHEQLYSRAGTNYKLEYNDTKNVYTDDTQASTNIESAKISGFVYLDANANGVKDERIGQHFSGATVKITDKDGNEILSTVTGINGYYELEVGVGEYTVSVTAPDGYSLANSTANVVVTHDKQLFTNVWGITK